MITEIITVGDELLCGKITDTNAAFLAKETSDLGIPCQFKQTVGDDKSNIHQALSQALKRSNIIIFTGGLGPTDDDLTIQAIADYFNAQMTFHEDIAAHIKRIFDLRCIPMPERNLKQANIPDSAQVLPNPVGTAPGIIWDVCPLLETDSPKIILTFPGVPYEMKRMWKETAKPYIASLSQAVLHQVYINFSGISESALVEKLGEIMDQQNPRVLPYAGQQVQLRVFSFDKSIDAAKKNVENTITKIKTLVGEFIYGYDDDTLESVIGKLLLENNMTVSVAESCTGGLISSRLTDVSGSSKYIMLNATTYANEAKTSLLNVPEQYFVEHGAVSEQVAKAMAEGIRKIAKTDIGLSVTGIAGPTGGSVAKPVGTMYIGLADKQTSKAFRVNVNPSLQRSQIKWRFSQAALDALRKHLLLNCEKKYN